MCACPCVFCWLQVLFYMATKSFLQPFHPVSKFVAVKVVVFMTYWQSFVVDMIPGHAGEVAHKWMVHCRLYAPPHKLHVAPFPA